MPRPDARPGRGAPENRTPTRFNLPQREADGDWLDLREEVDDGPPPLRTTVTVEKPKTIINRNISPDIGFDRSVRGFRGCEHGCIYCFARPTHAYHDLSPGVDFESRLFVKPDAPQLLHAALSRPGYECRPIAMGTNTDPYQPIEERWRVTRSVIELLLETRHPFTITTKSDRVLRDIDILKQAGALRIASVALSVTSLDPKVARTLEPRAPQPRKRLAAMKTLNEAGAPGGFYLPVRLPHEVAPLFKAWLDEHYPDRASKVMATIRALRGGRDNDPDFFSRMRGQGP